MDDRIVLAIATWTCAFIVLALCSAQNYSPLFVTSLNTTYALTGARSFTEWYKQHFCIRHINIKPLVHFYR